MDCKPIAERPERQDSLRLWAVVETLLQQCEVRFILVFTTWDLLVVSA